MKMALTLGMIAFDVLLILAILRKKSNNWKGKKSLKNETA